MEDAARAVGVPIQPGLRVRTGSTVNRLKVEVKAARQVTPVIPTISPLRIPALASLLGLLVNLSLTFGRR